MLAEHEFRPPLVPAELVLRENRFLAEVLIGGRPALAHVPSSGRLAELLIPGAEVLLQPAQPARTRRTRFTLVGVRHQRPSGNTWVCIDTGLANRLASLLLQGRRVPGLNHLSQVHAEVTVGDSRLDFRLESGDGQCGWAEVKCVTLAVGDQARFPDAPTVRGAKHLRHLTQVAQEGGTAAVLFVVQRDDVSTFAPNLEQDAVFATALGEAAQAGVLVHAVSCIMNAERLAAVRWLPVVRPRAVSP